MGLSFTAALAARGFDVDLEVAAGETVAVLGPNGAGKSTLLNLIAGLVAPDRGRASIDGEVVFDAGSGNQSVWVPPHRRGVSLLLQDALLFPHLSVLSNVAFGQTSAGTSRREAQRVAREWLSRVDAAELEDRRPAQLSGGQAQRIAVARALAAAPRLLLLDEPMAALDIEVAPLVRRMLRDVLQGRTSVIVTHDILDAYSLADRVVVLDAGRIVQQGATRDVFERPRHPFTAGLAGVSLVRGRVQDASTDGAVSVQAEQGFVIRGHSAPDDALRPGDEVIAAVRPENVSVRPRSSPPATAATHVEVRIDDIEPRGPVVRVRAGALAADLRVPDAAALDLAPGDAVVLGVAPADVVVYRA